MQRINTEELAEQGYTIVRGVLDPATDLAPVKEEFAEILDGVVSDLLAAGKIDQTYGELPFEERLIAVQRAAGVDLAIKFDPTLPASMISEEDEINLRPRMFSLLTNEKLLDVVSAVIGPDIAINPVNHVRMKVPLSKAPKVTGALTGTTPWHQDLGACVEDADESRIVIAWLPINVPLVETGTLQVIPRSNHGGLMRHTGPDPRIRAGSVAIPADTIDVDRAVPILVAPGDVVLMTMKITHGSLPNVSENKLRISAEFRYQRPGDHSGRNALLPTFTIREGGKRADLTADKWRDAWLKARVKLATVGPLRWHRWSAA